MIVDVVHPSPVTHVPRGARMPRETLARTVTPVEIEPVTAPSFRLVADLASSATPGRVYEHRGRLWRRLDVPRPGRPSEPVSPAQWLNFLSNDNPGNDRDRRHILGEVAMGPLAALVRGPDAAENTTRPRGHRGDALDFSAQRRVEADGRAGAAARVTDWLRNETVVANTMVLVAYRPMAHTAQCHGTMRYVGERHRMRLGDVLYRPGRAEEVLSAALGDRAAERARDPWAGFRMDRDALAGFEEDDEDLRFLANWLPAHAASYLDLTHLSHGGDGPAAKHAAKDALCPWLTPASLGAIQGEDVRTVLGLVRAAAELIVGGPEGRAAARRIDALKQPGNAWQPAWESVACIMEAGLGRLAAPPAPEDEDALAGLGAMSP